MKNFYDVLHRIDLIKRNFQKIKTTRDVIRKAKINSTIQLPEYVINSKINALPKLKKTCIQEVEQFKKDLFILTQKRKFNLIKYLLNSLARENSLPDFFSGRFKIKYKNKINHTNKSFKLYRKILPYALLAQQIDITDSEEDQKVSAHGQARKLSLLCEGLSNALIYLKSYPNSRKNDNAYFFNACQFSVPTGQWNVKDWKILFRKNRYYPPLVSLYEQAPALEESIKKDQTDFTPEMDLNTLFKTACMISYRDYHKNSEAALLFKRYKLSEASFNLYISIQEYTEQVPDEITWMLSDNELAKQYNIAFKKNWEKENMPHIPNVVLEINFPHHQFYIKKMDIEDPMAALLGYFTKCCQALGMAGEDCTLHGLTSIYGGFYVMYLRSNPHQKENDVIFAQTWAWKALDGALVFDSIEMARNVSHQMNDYSQQAYVNNSFTYLAKYLIHKFNIPYVNCGRGSGLNAGIFTDNPPAKFIDYTSYSDAKQQNCLYHKNYPQSTYVSDCLGDLSILLKSRFDNLFAHHEKNSKLKAKIFVDETPAVIIDYEDEASLKEHSAKGNLSGYAKFYLNKNLALFSLINLKEQNIFYLVCYLLRFIASENWLRELLVSNNFDELFNSVTNPQRAIILTESLMYGMKSNNYVNFREMVYLLFQSETCLIESLHHSKFMLYYLKITFVTNDNILFEYLNTFSEKVKINHKILMAQAYLYKNNEIALKIFDKYFVKKVFSNILFAFNLFVKYRSLDGMQKIISYLGPGYDYWHLLFSKNSFNCKVAKILIKNGVNINAVHNNKTSLIWAIDIHDKKLFSFLIKNGANFRGVPDSISPLEYILIKNKPKSIGIIKLLVKKGINVNTHFHQDSLLCYAIRHQKIELIKWLIKKGADLTPNSVIDQEKILQKAQETKNLSIVKIIEAASQPSLFFKHGPSHQNKLKEQEAIQIKKLVM